jgi:hypothetical protein
MSGALIQLVANETFKERNELVGLELGVFVFASAVAVWLWFTHRTFQMRT